LILAIKDNYETLWDTCLISQQGVGVINKGAIVDPVSNIETPDEDDLTPDDPWMQTIARYALRDNGIPCTIKDVRIGIGETFTEDGNTRLYYTYVVDIEIPYNFLNIQSVFVQEIVNDLVADYSSVDANLKTTYTNGYYTKQAIQGISTANLEDDPELLTRSYRLWENESAEIDSIYSALWYKNPETDIWYLRAAPFINPRAYGLKYKQLSQYFLSILDTGYRKKKTSWFKKFIAAVVFVLAVWYLGPVFGGGIIGYAQAVVVASLVLSIASLLLGALGFEELATAFAEVNKAIEPLVMIASIIVMVNGFNQQFVQKTAEKSIEEAIKEYVTELVDDFVEKLVEGATDAIAGNITAASLGFTEKMVRLASMPFQLKLDSLNDRNRDLKAEYDKLIEEANRETDVLRGFARIYAKPATADWSMFSSLYDYPYERGGGQLAIGNIQRTTKQALRKADYDDPAFDNILVV